jgi:putative peptidoglycan lipid II flippase
MISGGPGIEVEAGKGWIRPAEWITTADRQIVGAILTVATATGVVKIATLAKEVTIAARFGAGDAIDAFVIAFLLPSFVISVLATAFQAAVIPAFVQVRDQEGPDAGRALIANVVSWSCLLLMGFAVLLAMVAPLALAVTASGFSPEKISLTRTLFYCVLPLIVLNGFTAIWSAVLNAERHFAFVSLTPLFTPLAIVAGLYAFRDATVLVLPIAMIVGALLEAVVIGLSAVRLGLWVRPAYGRRNPTAQTMVGQFVTMAAGAVLMSSTGVTDLAMAAMLGPGSVSTLNYGNRIVLFLLGFCAAAMSTVLLPHFSALAARRAWSDIRHTVNRYLVWIAATSVPLTLLAIVLSETLTRVMFQRGAFDASVTSLVAPVQALYFIQVPFYLMGILLVRVISSLKANHLLLYGSAISLVINLLLNYTLMMVMGVKGIALATSIVYIASFCFLFYVSSRSLAQASAAEA